MSAVPRIRVVPVLIVLMCTGLLAGSIVDSQSRGGTETIATNDDVPRYAGPSLDPGRADGSGGKAAQKISTVATPSRTNKCLNSLGKPRCGEAHWDPPVVDKPATLSVDISPQVPREGQLVTFTFTWSDGDADTPLFSFCDGYSGCGYTKADHACRPESTGPWSPPAVRPGGGRIVKTFVYPESGTYNMSAGVDTESSAYQALIDRFPCLTLPDPYQSSAGVAQQVTVVPPSWPEQPLEDDLAYVKTQSTDRDHVELHTLTRSSGYQAQHSLRTALPNSSRNDGVFNLIDMDGRRHVELVHIQTTATLSDTVEVNTVIPNSAGAPADQDLSFEPIASWESGTSDLRTAAARDGSVQMADMDGDGHPELVFIRSRDDGSGRVELSWYRAPATRFAQAVHYAFAGSARTSMQADPAEGSFQLKDVDQDGRPDLVFMQTETASGRVEVNWYTASSGFHDHGSATSGLSTVDLRDGDLQMANMDRDHRPDLVFIKSTATASGQVEVHWLTAATGFSERAASPTKFSVAEHPLGQFSMVDADGY
jgi:hypothetical protein